ncbi:MAG: hypothetical protein PHG03_00115 [Bacilli bacterium]|nr:hypothetical protein [Bacilli bacterium]MDD4794955.1 hypothetical protein [Bacilli bacterium]
MNREEIKTLFKRIKANYDIFSVSKEKLDEWEKILKGYTTWGVNRNLDEYLREGKDTPPIAINLINEFIKVPNPNVNYKTSCKICGRIIDLEYTTHENRCRSIDYITKKTTKYFLDKLPDLNAQLKELYDMSENAFDLFYKKFMKQLLNQDIDLEEKNLIKKILSDTENINIDDVIKGIL